MNASGASFNEASNAWFNRRCLLLISLIQLSDLLKQSADRLSLARVDSILSELHLGALRLKIVITLVFVSAEDSRFLHVSGIASALVSFLRRWDLD